MWGPVPKWTVSPLIESWTEFADEKFDTITTLMRLVKKTT